MASSQGRRRSQFEPTLQGLTTQAAYAYTGSGDRAFRLAEHIECGIVGLNDALSWVAFAPMGGAKQWGLGLEGVRIGLEEFQDLRYLSIETR